MCRLLGIYGYIDFWQDLLMEFQKQAEFGKNAPHKDGWGIAKANEATYSMSIHYKEKESAYQSLAFKEVISSLYKQPEILLCHLRKASPNVALTLSNVQPFIAEKWAFIHNGTIYDAETLTPKLSFIRTSEDSDSEYFFHYLLAEFPYRNNKTEDLTSLMSAILKMNIKFSSLNSMLSNGKDLYIIRWCSRSFNYYTLFYYIIKNAVIISSEPIECASLDLKNWQKVPNRSILKIFGKPIQIETLKYSNLLK